MKATKINPYISVQVISLNPELNGWSVIEDRENAIPLALSFPVKDDADRVAKFVNAAYARGARRADQSTRDSSSNTNGST